MSNGANEPQIEQWDKVFARFTPKRLETLKPELAEAAGVTAEFCCSWIIDEDDGGPYVGQGAFHTEDERFHHLWVPQEDLDIIQVLSEAPSLQTHTLQ